MNTIYLDHSATTPVDPEVLGAMMRYFGNHFGNPSSIHGFGQEAKKAIEAAREQVAALIGADPAEIVFTGGGTEADNMALMGVAFAEMSGKNHIITSAIEHHAILNTCKYLETRGFKVTYLPVDAQGVVHPEEVQKAITDKTFLISIMHANNEIGTIEPIPEIGYMARQRGILMHTDAMQTVGKIPVRVDDLNVDLLSLAAHKFYGPKGTGALYIKKKTLMNPILFGGHQEGGRRTGTENVPGIVGLGKACEVAARDLPFQMDRLNTLRNSMEKQMTEKSPNLLHILSISFPSISGESIVRELDKRGIAASPGAACTADTITVSHVMAALNVPKDFAMGTVRFSLGKGNREEEITHTAEVLTEIVQKLKGMAELEATVGMRGCR
jgi:cysteine desulfurase